MVRGFVPTTYCDLECITYERNNFSRSRVTLRPLLSPVGNLRAIIGEIFGTKLDMGGSGGMIGRVSDAIPSTSVDPTVFHRLDRFPRYVRYVKRREETQSACPTR